MLSILIPVHNFNVISLVKILNQEVEKMNISFEIICIDDASDQKEIQRFNKKINDYKNCLYEILPSNIGRSKVRNYLAEKANYENFLFLDADVLPKSQRFIQNYIKALQNNDIIFGGISYPKMSSEYNELLHFSYGKTREAQSYNKRKKNVNFFTSANFAIKKDLFNEIRFNETIKTYGFEDILFSKKILLNNYKINQIDNEVIHHGIIKNNHDFILKSQESLKTLHQLYKNKNLNQDDVRLLYYYTILKNINAHYLFAKFFKTIKKILLKNLTSNKPSLFIFDIYRLGYFTTIKN